MTTPLYGWVTPDLATTPPDGPAAFQSLATAIETTLATPAAAYTPTWTSDGTVQPALPLTLVGRYRISGKNCRVAVSMTFGPSTTGGRMGLLVGLPAPAALDMQDQILTCSSLAGGGIWTGVALIDAGSSVARPWFNQDDGRAHIQPWSSADTTGAVGTGIPYRAGQQTVANGGNFSMTGRYRIA